MLASIDRAGRVVIPKELRDRLSIEPGSDLELTTDGEALRLTPVRRSRRVVVDADGWPVIVALDAVSITDADVQRWRDADQR